LCGWVNGWWWAASKTGEGTQGVKWLVVNQVGVQGGARLQDQLLEEIAGTTAKAQGVCQCCATSLTH